ncbi:GNAT family N-acetyltransferase [Blastopirellula sp. JC732]|uniref:GNAT family N-acetyltransferase n=1 Tax=Blastopirellula sediminis TaxID=2894196 RepID=A0A9X1MTW5_9BACT|nr:GNAT family N-acetyltransferase [Blastopirellula sediminis]MCC9604699.1 GNAT family N-acetyltransferase [Blastopirellula sediminis]MCC9632002.1 GNAT family N-acetyltransferase [Blastopirellula sediminis]
MIRRYEPGDHTAIAEIFTRAIHEVASEVYTPAQCAAWSDKRPNPEHWKTRCEQKRPYVYVSEGRVAGFLELDDDGHIDCMYVHPEEVRKGIASALVDLAIENCVAAGLLRVFVEASHCARPVFEKKGFRVVEERQVALNGELLTNFAMELPLDDSSNLG